MKHPVRIQVDNSLRYSVNLIVLENESYLEIRDRFKNTINQIPVAQKMIKIKVCFYKSQWIYRLFTKLPYAHVNIELPDGCVINNDLRKSDCGLLDGYGLPPDYVIETYAKEEDIRKAIQEAQKPLSLWTIFGKRNCFTVSALALGGGGMKTIRKIYKEHLKTETETGPESIQKNF